MAIKPTWILCTYRTGSTYLASSLNSTGLFEPNFKEHFKDHQIEAGYYDKKIPKFAKVHRNLFLNLFKDKYKGIHKVNKFYPNIQFIHLRRKNIIDQTLSHYFAAICKKFVVYEKDDLKKFQNTHVEYDKKKLYNLYKVIKKNYNSWYKFLDGQNYIDVYYEDLLQKPTEKFIEILNFIGVKKPEKISIEPYNLKQSHPQKEEIKNKFTKFLKRKEKNQ